jgi:hypothetical protein
MQERIYINEVGAIKFNNYDSTNRTGTPTYLLGTDASGNIVKTNTVPGSAAGPYLPLAGGLMTGTGNITMPDNFELRAGTDSDLIIYHNGTNNFILNTVGNLNIRNTADDGNITFQSDDGSGGYTSYFIIDGGSAQTQVYKDFRFQDDVKAKFGTGSDLQIYHDGSNSFINNLTGDLTIENTGDDLILKAADDFLAYVQGTDIAIQAIGDGKVGLRYDNVEKLATTSTGVTVTGYATASEFYVVNNNFGLFCGDNLTGAIGSFGGIIDMNSNKITELAPGSNNLDAVNYQQLQDAVAGVLVYQGTWNASTNTPTLASGVGTPGYYYIVSVAGSTNLDGITDWLPGDWAIFSDQATDVWQKIDHTNVLNGAGTGNKVTKWSGSGTSYTLTDSSITDTGSLVTIANPLTVTGNITGVRGFFDSGTTNVVSTFTSTDATATLQCIDSGGNVEFGASGNNFVVQPAGGVTQLTVGATTSTFAGNVIHLF